MPGTEGIFMTSKEQFIHKVLQEFLDRKRTRKEVAMLLQIDERSVSRKAKRLREKGLIGVLHGNKGKVPANKKPEPLKQRVLRLIRRKYFDFNAVHALEMIAKNEEINVSYSVLYSWLREAGLVKRMKRRQGVARHLRARLPCEGLMLQMDGSHHDWNGKDRWVLIGAIDDATSKIPWAEFFTSEDTLNCMTILQRIIERVGIPEMIYTDKAGWLGGTTKRDGFNHFMGACETLGIKIIFANSPQAKGRIERAWNTFQDRIIPEMRLNKIKELPEANQFLQEQFLPNYWNVKNTVPARQSEIRYRPLPDGVDLSEIFCMKELRQVKNNHTISVDNRLYKITPPDRTSLKGRNVELRTYQDLKTKVFFCGLEVKFELIQDSPRIKPLRVRNIAGVNSKEAKNIFYENMENRWRNLEIKNVGTKEESNHVVGEEEYENERILKAS